MLSIQVMQAVSYHCFKWLSLIGQLSVMGWAGCRPEGIKFCCHGTFPIWHELSCETRKHDHFALAARHILIHAVYLMAKLVFVSCLVTRFGQRCIWFLNRVTHSFTKRIFRMLQRILNSACVYFQTVKGARLTSRHWLCFVWVCWCCAELPQLGWPEEVEHACWLLGFQLH